MLIERRSWLRSTLMVTLPAVSALLGLQASAAADECTPPPFGTGDYWVSSFNTDEILRFDQEGTFLGAFTSATLNGPRGITVTATGEVYVTSQLTNEIEVFAV